MTNTSVLPASGSNKSNTGAIVGGAIGGPSFLSLISINRNSKFKSLLGVGGLLILAALIFFCLRKRRKDIFDGNFDPAIVGSSSAGGGTLPKIDLGENGLLMDGNGVGVDEDDGMGGRLGVGPGGGGIITPYSFQPAAPAPIGGMAIGGGGNAQQFGGGQQLQGQLPQMQQMSNIGVMGADGGVAAVGGGAAAAAGVAAVSATGYPNEKRAMRQQQQQQYGRHTPNQSVSSGSLYPSSTQQMMIMNSPNGTSSPEPEPYSADGSSSFGGSGGSGSGGGIYYQTMGRGPGGQGQGQMLPVLSSSSSGGRRNAKEIEAMGGGRVMIANPDENGRQIPAFQQAYLQNGPGPHQQQYLPSTSSSVPSHQQHRVSRAGTAVVVHEDGGRVVLRGKGEEGEEEGEREVLSPEIPPTYDSLPVDVRRES